jgi:hypothetical protein
MNQRIRPGVTDPVILMFSRRQVETCDLDEPLDLRRNPTSAGSGVLGACGLTRGAERLHSQ